jgi:hypothetical protein
MTKKPHKHAEFIKAWADGAEIQTYDGIRDVWVDIISNPAWTSERYRIKPVPKPDIVYYGVFDMNRSTVLECFFTKLIGKGDELKLIFDGETGKLKSAEVLT